MALGGNVQRYGLNFQPQPLQAPQIQPAQIQVNRRQQKALAVGCCTGYLFGAFFGWVLRLAIVRL